MCSFRLRRLTLAGAPGLAKRGRPTGSELIGCAAADRLRQREPGRGPAQIGRGMAAVWLDRVGHGGVDGGGEGGALGEGAAGAGAAGHAGLEAREEAGVPAGDALDRLRSRRTSGVKQV
jgi:hypothetical protein